jgi:H+-translocating NAD(P) transhydrogenase subunit alpha
MNFLKAFFIVLVCLSSGLGLVDTCYGADSPSDPSSVSQSYSTMGFTENQISGLIAGLTIFVLAIFVGFEVITKVPPTLHTPLMSGSNAISGITLVGAVVAAGAGGQTLAIVLGTLAVALATVNVVGGFLVTHRMLQMFRKK